MGGDSVMIKKVSRFKLFFFRAKFMLGAPERMLHKYFVKMPELPIRDSGPLKVRNWVASTIRNQTDEILYGVKEKWPQNYSDLQKIMDTRTDDCDGHAVLAASILHTMGNHDIRLAYGFYGVGDGAFGNHAYCLLHNHSEPENPYLIDCADKKILKELPKIKMQPFYKTHFMCDALGNYWEIT